MSEGLRKAYDASVEVNAQVADVDAALVEVGRAIADQIDYAVDNLEGSDLTKALYLTPHLMNVLREMHATPESRRAAGVVIKDAKAGGERAKSSRSAARLESLKGGKSA